MVVGVVLRVRAAGKRERRERESGVGGGLRLEREVVGWVLPRDQVEVGVFFFGESWNIPRGTLRHARACLPASTLTLLSMPRQSGVVCHQIADGDTEREAWLVCSCQVREGTVLM